MSLSVLDLAPVREGQPLGEALADSVTLAQTAEALGYERVWYAEHHNMATIASSATAVLIAHVAARTERIRLGSGGVMLPNHAPLVIAEQFGTLAELHPGRIDLGLGRAPGTDGNTMRALRRDFQAADTFPQDVLELQGYLDDDTRIPHVNATPGRGTHVPLYILGSSLFGAQLAAHLGLPYAFASHFAPAALHDAITIYRERFQPSAQLQQPYVLAAINVLAADDEAEARRQLGVRRATLARLLRMHPAQLDGMFVHTALGTADAVHEHLERFRQDTGADELITVHQADTVEGRVRSLEITAQAVPLPAR